MTDTAQSPNATEAETPRLSVAAAGSGRCFGVRFSGHGSGFLPEHPLYNLTLEEAKAQALEWELRSDTIGGRAEIVTCLDFLP